MAPNRAVNVPIARREHFNEGGTVAQVKDPVCGMVIDDDSAVGTSEYQGQHYYFCSSECKIEFDENPADYADASGGAVGGGNAPGPM